MPKYELVFIDGPKDWTNDGCAFFLADKLLRPGGTIVFDDYSWSYRADAAARGKTHDRGYIFEHMSSEEFENPHVEAIVRLLVMQHPDYSDFQILDNQMAIAKKAPSLRKQVRFETQFSVRYRVVSVLRELAKYARSARSGSPP